MNVMKQIAALMLCLSSILCLSECSSGEDDFSVTTTEYIETEPETEAVTYNYDDLADITENRTKTTDRLLSTVTCNGIECPSEGRARCFYISAYGAESWDDLDVDFVLEDENAQVTIIDNRLFTYSLSEAIALGRETDCVIYNDENYEIVSFIITSLPIMTISEGEGASTQGNHPFMDTDVLTYMTLITSDDVKESYCNIHRRGGSSRGYSKCGYKLGLVDENGEKADLNLLGLRKDDDWILTPMYTDESKIRDKLSSDLWLEIGACDNDYGICYGIKIEYIELMINGRYWGLFGLTVPIDGKTTDLDEENGEVLFKLNSWVYPKEKAMLTAGSKTRIDSLTIKKPNEVTQSVWDRIAEFYHAAAYSSDSEFENTISEYIDIDNAIDYWIFINAIAGQDNQYKNSFICLKNDDDGSFTALLAPWDCDLSWGVLYDEQQSLQYSRSMDYLSTDLMNVDILYRLQWSDVDGYRDRLVNRWKELRSGVLSTESVLAKIDELDSIVRGSGAYKRDHARWPNGGSSQDTTYIKTFAQKRLAFLDDYIESNY